MCASSRYHSPAGAFERGLEGDLSASGAGYASPERLDVRPPHDLVADAREPQRVDVLPISAVVQHLQASSKCGDAIVSAHGPATLAERPALWLLRGIRDESTTCTAHSMQWTTTC